MTHPGGGRNDIPERLKRHFLLFNLVLPALESINDLFGQMLGGRFPSADYDSATNKVVSKLTEATISLWNLMKTKMLQLQPSSIMSLICVNSVEFFRAYFLPQKKLSLLVVRRAEKMSRSPFYDFGSMKMKGYFVIS